MARSFCLRNKWNRNKSRVAPDCVLILQPASQSAKRPLTDGRCATRLLTEIADSFRCRAQGRWTLPGTVSSFGLIIGFHFAASWRTRLRERRKCAVIYASLAVVRLAKTLNARKTCRARARQSSRIWELQINFDETKQRNISRICETLSCSYVQSETAFASDRCWQPRISPFITLRTLSGVSLPFNYPGTLGSLKNLQSIFPRRGCLGRSLLAFSFSTLSQLNKFQAGVSFKFIWI